jgi:hypothetical protein
VRRQEGSLHSTIRITVEPGDRRRSASGCTSTRSSTCRRGRRCLLLLLLLLLLLGTLLLLTCMHSLCLLLSLPLPRCLLCSRSITLSSFLLLGLLRSIFSVSLLSSSQSLCFKVSGSRR